MDKTLLLISGGFITLVLLAFLLNVILKRKKKIAPSHLLRKKEALKKEFEKREQNLRMYKKLMNTIGSLRNITQREFNEIKVLQQQLEDKYKIRRLDLQILHDISFDNEKLILTLDRTGEADYVSLDEKMIKHFRACKQLAEENQLWLNYTLSASDNTWNTAEFLTERRKIINTLSQQAKDLHKQITERISTSFESSI